jgi:hypothetical protein
MCAYSMIADYYHDKWREQTFYPHILPQSPLSIPMPAVSPTLQRSPPITRDEFDALKADIGEMKQLLKRAMKYDIDNGEPHCESAEKVAVLRRAAALVGETVEDVLPPS